MIKYFTTHNFLSNDECDKILNFSLKQLRLQTATVGNSEVNEKKRKSSVSFYDYNNAFPFLKEKLLTEVTNKIKLKGYYVNFENTLIQFTEYKEGEYYNWHTDSADFGQFKDRYCSIVIQLNDEYTGGELEMIDKNDDAETTITFEKGKGNLFVFLSNMSHRVTEVTTGNRYSLVGWFSVKPENNYKKTLI